MLPKALQPGMTIGVFSPSSAATAWAPTRSERAVRYLQSKGYRIKKGKLWGENDHYRSAGIQQRVAEFNALIHDPEVDIIMSCIGGANSNSLLPYIDYDALNNSKKIVVGYSDVTAILLAIYAKTGLTTYYGPALTASFGEMPPLVEETFTCFQQVSASPGASFHYALPDHWTDVMIDWESQNGPKPVQPTTIRFHGTGVVSGRVIGGNLNTMTAIWGSEYMPVIKTGDILLIEDSMKDIATMERLFAFLLLQGVFDRVSAILLGKHELFKDAGTARTPFDVLTEVLNGRSIPIVEDFDCSHTHPMLTVPIGASMQIDFDLKTVSLVCSDD